MKKFFAVMVSFVFVMMAHAQFANATALLYLTDGTNTATVNANSLGSAVYNDSLGNWTIIVSSGLSHPTETLPALLNLNIQATPGTGASALQVYFVDNGFPGTPYGLESYDLTATNNTPKSDTQFNNTESLIEGSTVDANGIITGGTTIASVSNLLNTDGQTVGGPLASLSTTDYLELYGSLAPATVGQTQNLNLAASVPEPGTILLLGIGLLAFALVRTKIAKQNS